MVAKELKWHFEWSMVIVARSNRHAISEMMVIFDTARYTISRVYRESLTELIAVQRVDRQRKYKNIRDSQ